MYPINPWPKPHDTYLDGITYFVGYAWTENESICFGLLRDGKVLTVQVPAGSDREFEIGHLQTMLNSFAFERSGWAYLLPKLNGGRKIIYRKEPYPFRCTYPLWLPIVEESQIKYTKWIGLNLREGIWNGREIDMVVATNEIKTWRVKTESQQARELQRRGLLWITFEPLCHIAQDGCPIGIGYERIAGRCITYDDRIKVYEAVRVLARNGVRHDILIEDNIVIKDEQVRFVASLGWRFYSRRQKKQLRRDLQDRSYPQLERLFKDLATKPHSCVIHTRIFLTTAWLMPSMPPPSRPMQVDHETLQSAFQLFVNNFEKDDILVTYIERFRCLMASNPRYAQSYKISLGAIGGIDAEDAQEIGGPLLPKLRDRQKAQLASRRTRTSLTQVLHPYARQHKAAKILLAPSHSLTKHEHSRCLEATIGTDDAPLSIQAIIGRC